MNVITNGLVLTPISGNSRANNIVIASYFPPFRNFSQFRIDKLTVLEWLKVYEPRLEERLCLLFQIAIYLITTYLPLDSNKKAEIFAHVEIIN